jgi:lipopolysaccharide export system protein LptC
LLVKDRGKTHYSLPGGKVRHNERSYQAAVTLPHLIVHCELEFSRFCERIAVGLNRPKNYAV